MPLTQNAPREPGCCGFGAILVTLPSSMVRNEPHSAEHSQQVEGTISLAGRAEGRTFIARKAIQVPCGRKWGFGAACAKPSTRRTHMPGRYAAYAKLKLDHPAPRVLRITFDRPETYN